MDTNYVIKQVLGSAVVIGLFFLVLWYFRKAR